MLSAAAAGRGGATAGTAPGRDLALGVEGSGPITARGVWGGAWSSGGGWVGHLTPGGSAEELRGQGEEPGP